MAAGGSQDKGLFCADWTAGEEIQLLETVEEFGYGNWTCVSDKIGRPSEECRSHYNHVYLDSPHPMLPVPTRPIISQSKQLHFVSSLNDRGNNQVPPYYSGQEIGCYMPHRGDFAVEPMNDAEGIISDLELEPDEEEDELIIVLKLAAVKMYCAKIRERAFRKWIVREYGLIDIRKRTATDKITLTRNQLAIKRTLRPFMRFMPPQTAYKLIQSLFLADELREEIRKFKDYRSNGITTIQGAELCDSLKKKRKSKRAQHGEAIKNACTVEESLFSQLVLRKPEEKTVAKDKPLSLYDISHLSGVEKLSPEERELCLTCRLHPETLLVYITQLETEWKRAGGVLRLVEARRILKIDVNKTRKIYNFLVSKGRITQ